MNKQKIKEIVKFSIKQNIQNIWFVGFNVLLLVLMILFANAGNIKEFLENNNIQIFDDEVAIEYVDPNNIIDHKLERMFAKNEKVTVKKVSENKYTPKNIKDNVLIVEVDKDEEGALYLVVHSGSRHLGMEVTEYYLKEGQRVSQMKKQGHAPYDLTCLEGELLEDYLHDLGIVQEFARLNREAMIDEIARGMKWKQLDSYTCVHNYVDFSGAVPILRKGAISAKEGEQVIIPMNMRDGIILGTGLGNDEWNCSAPHGSGRVYRRSEVKEHHTVSEFKKAMEGIYSICINKDTLDESPFAYRKIEDMLNVIEETVKIDKIIKPVYNFKAGGSAK